MDFHHPSPPHFLHMCSPLPRGWEQCLDLKSGLVFFKNLITGARTYSDPRLTQSGSCGADEGVKNGSLVQAETNSSWSSPLQQPNYPYLPPAVFSGQLERGSIEQRDPIDKQIDLDLRLSLKSIDESSPCSSLTLLSAPNEHPRLMPHRVPITPISPLSLSSTSKCSSSSSSPSVISFQEDEEAVEALEVESSEQGRYGIDRNAEDMEAVTETMITAGCLKCLMYVLLSSKDPRCPQCGNTMLFNFPTTHASEQSYESTCPRLVQYFL